MIIMPGEQEPRRQSASLSPDLIRAEMTRVLEQHEAFKARMRIAALRKSCGVEPSKTATISVRRPPRYTGLANG